jgi:hypothetical protein
MNAKLSTLVVLAVAIAATCAAAPALAGPVTSAGCLQPHPSGYTALPQDGDSYVVLATRATRHRALGLQAVMRARRIYETWATDFAVDGNTATVLGPGAGQPYEIFVVAHRNAFFRSSRADGADLPLCSAGGSVDDLHDGMIVEDDLASEPGPDGPVDWSANVLAHELFHAFQGGVIGHYPDAGTWWLEATAEWGGDANFGVPRSRVTQLDSSLFGHPELALDELTRTGSGDEARHPYAEWRFVQYLARQLGPGALFPYLVDTFRALGNGTDVNQAITDNGAQAIDVQLGGFWAHHLPPTSGTTAPARIQEHPEITAGGSHTERFEADARAANVFRYRLASDVKQVDIDIPSSYAGQHGQLWQRLGGQTAREVTPGTEHFCVGGDDETAQQWPGDITFAYVNGDLSAGATDHTLAITATGSTHECSHAHPAHPPTPTPSGGTCPVRSGYYSTDSQTPDFFVKIDCPGMGEPQLTAIGGAVVCPDGQPANLGPAIVYGQVLHILLDASGSASATWMYSGGTFHATVDAGSSQSTSMVTGTVTFDRAATATQDACDVVYPFTLPWESH